jgi:hypothetical protein
MRELTPAAETVYGVRSSLDLRHDPGKKKHHEKIEPFQEHPDQRRDFHTGLESAWIRRAQLMADNSYT